MIAKYKILKDTFGLSAHQIQNVSKTYRERQIKIRKVRDQFRIIEPDNYPRLQKVIEILKKPSGKRSQELLSTYIVPLIENLDFFSVKKGLTPYDLENVAQNIKYKYMEPGQTIYQAG